MYKSCSEEVQELPERSTRVTWKKYKSYLKEVQELYKRYIWSEEEDVELSVYSSGKNMITFSSLGVQLRFVTQDFLKEMNDNCYSMN